MGSRPLETTAKSAPNASAGALARPNAFGNDDVAAVAPGDQIDDLGQLAGVEQHA